MTSTAPGDVPRQLAAHANDNRRLDLLAVVAYVAFAVALVWPVLLGKVPVASDTLYLWAPWSQTAHAPVNTPVLADSALLYLPWMAFAREAVQSGQWPLWDPNSFAGFPYAANSQSQLYYPLAWLLWLLPLSGAIQVLVVFNIWLAGAGMYLFTRHLGVSRTAAFIAGLAFAGSGIMQLVIELWGVSSVYGWLPWILYAADRALVERHVGWTALAAAAVALQLVAGHPQYAVYALFALACWVLWRMLGAARGRSIRLAGEYAARSAAIVTLGFGAALVHIAPLIELSSLSSRASVRVSSNSPPLSSMLRLLVPEYFGDGSGAGSPLVFNDLWYVGIPTLFLAAIVLLIRPRRQIWFWALLAAVAIAVAYGIGWFLYVRWLPGLSGMLPIRIGYILVFASSVLAAYGLDAWKAAAKTGTKLPLVALATVAALSALALGAAFAGRDATTDLALRTLQGEQLVRAGALVILTAATLAVIGVMARSKRLRRPGQWATGALVTLLIFDLLTAVPGYNTFVDSHEIIPASPAVDWLRSQHGDGRVLGRGTGDEQPVLVPNVQMLYGFPSVSGYDSLHTRDYEDLWSAVDPAVRPGLGSTPYSNVFVRPQAYTSTAAALLGVRYVATTAALPASPGVTLAYNGEILIYSIEPKLPHAFFLASNDVLSRENIRGRMAEPNFDPGRAVLLNEDESPPSIEQPVADPSLVAAEVVRSDLNTAEVLVEAPTSGWLVLSDANYPGWAASVNGRDTPVYSAYLGLRAVPVAAGQSNVRFHFTPTTFAFSVPITLLCLTLLVLGAIRGFQRRQAGIMSLQK